MRLLKLPMFLKKNIERKMIPMIVHTVVIKPATTPSPTGYANSEPNSKNRGVQAYVAPNPRRTEQYNWTEKATKENWAHYYTVGNLI